MATLGTELIAPLGRVSAVLDTYDPVTQQKLIELLTVRHAMRMLEHAEFTADSMHKHIKQLIEQWRRDQ